MRLLTAGVLLLALAAAGAAQETTVYVDNAAAGANNGSSRADAYITLEAAIADARFANQGAGGCTILVAAGKGPYQGVFTLSKNHSGKAGRPNAIKAGPGAPPVLIGEGANGITVNGADHLVLDGLEVTTATRGGKKTIQGIALYGGNCTLLRMRVHDAPAVGIRVGGRGDVTIRQCILWRNGTINIYCKNMKGDLKLLVDHCTFYRAGGNADVPPYGELYFRRVAVASLEVKNCVFVEGASGRSVTSSISPIPAIKFHHNAHRMPFRWHKVEGAAEVAAWGEDDVNLAKDDPGFTDPEKGDFTLKADSILRGKAESGANLGAFPK